MEPAIQQVINAVSKQYGKQKLCRAMLTSFAHELGGLPSLRRCAESFTDRKLYPTRPMLTICKKPISVYLLGWREGDTTEIHDHGHGIEVSIVVLQGTITEDVFFAQPNTKKSPHMRCAGAISRQAGIGTAFTCPQNYIHRMGNLHPECAVTLHAYGPTLTDMCLYHEVGTTLMFQEHWRDGENAQH